MAHFVGLDVSVKETSVCVVDDAGTVISEQKVPTEPADIITLLTSLRVTYGRIGVEAGPLSQWLVNALTAADLPVICVETRHMKALLTAQQINKTDRNDARGMAQMMRVGLFKPVHVKTLVAQEQRMLLTQSQAASAQAAGRGARFARHVAQLRFESRRRPWLSIRGAGARARSRLSSVGGDRRATAKGPPGHAPARRPAQNAARHGSR
jgi:transposase